MSQRMVNVDELKIAKSDLSGTTYIGEFKSFGEHYEWKWKQPINIAIGTSEIDGKEKIVIGAIDSKKEKWLWGLEFSDLIGSENFKIERKEEEEAKA